MANPSTKPSKEDLEAQPLSKRDVKEGKALLKGVRKFLRYNDDLITEEKRGVIAEKREVFETALLDSSKTRKEVRKVADDLSDTCKKSVASYKPSAWKENVEVVFVAIVIAMGIRAYFFQQFKIPTGSMQPTLNGIIAYPTKETNPYSIYHAPEDYERPGFLKRAWDKVWYGRTHIEWVSKKDDLVILGGEGLQEKNPFFLFPWVTLTTREGQTFRAPGSKSRVEQLIARKNSNGMPIIQLKKGDVIAKGYLDTGDQLVVNKFIFHWTTPERDDVFVFNTRGISTIQNGLPDRRMGSQHYIKRLVGLPNDTLEIRPPNLHVNGQIPEAPGMQTVMNQSGVYKGYVIETKYSIFGTGKSNFELRDQQYWAMGDNSANSSDSRAWGHVPERNIVGKAVFVYYPFGHHFGPVR